MKKCPFCAEEIQDDSVKCKHCGEWFEKNSVSSGAKSGTSGISFTFIFFKMALLITVILITTSIAFGFYFLKDKKNSLLPEDIY